MAVNTNTKIPKVFIFNATRKSLGGGRNRSILALSTTGGTIYIFH